MMKRIGEDIEPLGAFEPRDAKRVIALLEAQQIPV
jgi:hypothetical protein